MRQEIYRKLCEDIRRGWSARDGAMAVLRTRNRPDADIRLCTAAVEEGCVTADSCTLWDGDRLAYEGRLGDPELGQELTRLGVCGGRITDSRHLSSLGRVRPVCCICPCGSCVGCQLAVGRC